MKLSAILAASFLAIAASALPTGGQVRALPKETPKEIELGLALDKRALPKETPKEIELGLALDKRALPKETPKQIELGLALDKRALPKETPKQIELGLALDKRALPKETPKEIELGLALDKRAKSKGADIIAQLQSTFDRNNPNGTPANGSPDDLNGDGVINAFEAGAQVA